MPDTDRDQAAKRREEFIARVLARAKPMSKEMRAEIVRLLARR